MANSTIISANGNVRISIEGETGDRQREDLAGEQREGVWAATAARKEGRGGGDRGSV